MNQEVRLACWGGVYLTLPYVPKWLLIFVHGSGVHESHVKAGLCSVHLPQLILFCICLSMRNMCLHTVLCLHQDTQFVQQCVCIFLKMHEVPYFISGWKC